MTPRQPWGTEFRKNTQDLQHRAQEATTVEAMGEVLSDAINLLGAAIELVYVLSKHTTSQTQQLRGDFK